MEMHLKRVSEQNELCIIEIKRDFWITALVLAALVEFANSDTLNTFQPQIVF